MKEFQTDPGQITIFYNPSDNTQEKAVAHATGTGKDVLAISYKEAPSAYNVWTKIYEALPSPKNGFFDESHPSYDSMVKDREFSFDDWRKVCVHNPDMIGVAVAISGDDVKVMERQTEVYDLQDLGPDAPKANADVAPENKANNSVDSGGLMLDR